MDTQVKQGRGAYKLDRAEALRYLGYAGQEVDSSLEARIEEVFQHCENVSQPAWMYRIFPVEVAHDAILLTGTTLRLEGQSIYAHLREARFCAAMVATCGLANERELQRLSALGGLDAVVFDAAGSALVEAAGNACNASIVAQAHASGLYTNYRFGPGYGDLPLSVQGPLLDVLGATRSLGVALTTSHMLVPAKSITAFVGIFDERQDSQPTCANCNFTAYCTLREKGQTCFQ